MKNRVGIKRNIAALLMTAVLAFIVFVVVTTRKECTSVRQETTLVRFTSRPEGLEEWVRSKNGM